MVICLEQGADLHMAQLEPLPLTISCFSKIQIGLPFWYQLTWVVPEKGPLNGCVCVCVCVVIVTVLIAVKLLNQNAILFYMALVNKFHQVPAANVQLGARFKS